MDQSKIESLMELMKKHGFNEMEIEDGDHKVHLVKSAPIVGGGAVSVAPMAMPQAAPTGSSATTEAPSATTGLAPGQSYVRSPFVGTFYEAPTPGADPFIQVGQSVSKGDVLCIIEAMKIMNEIEAESGGKIVKILVQNEEPVEFDQPLFILE